MYVFICEKNSGIFKNIPNIIDICIFIRFFVAPSAKLNIMNICIQRARKNEL